MHKKVDIDCVLDLEKMHLADFFMYHMKNRLLLATSAANLTYLVLATTNKKKTLLDLGLQISCYFLTIIFSYNLALAFFLFKPLTKGVFSDILKNAGY